MVIFFPIVEVPPTRFNANPYHPLLLMYMFLQSPPPLPNTRIKFAQTSCFISETLIRFLHMVSFFKLEATASRHYSFFYQIVRRFPPLS